MNLKKRRDMFSILFVCLAVACLMTACMNSATDTNAPQTTGMPMGIGDAVKPAESAPAAFDWMKNGQTVEEALARISEISEARVVTTGSTALVAVRFSPAYQGEMTARIREMIAGEVMRADPNVKTVAVTAENDDVARVYDLSDRLRGGAVIDSLENDINEIVRNATTLT